MNRAKYFDKCQLILAIVAVAATLMSTIFFIVMLITATPSYDETGAISEITYNYNIQMIYSIFFLTQLTALTWFIARTITYKMRMKEEDVL